MRFLTSFLSLAILAITTPSSFVIGDGQECYPSCSSFTAEFPSTASAQLTTWDGTIGINKFNPQGRTLTKITIKTKIYFESNVTVTCNGVGCSDAGTPSYKGSIIPGMQFKMGLDDSTASTLLSNYWGRWGDYPELTKTAKDTNKGGADLFVPYTYPLFDVEGFTPDNAGDLEVVGGNRWAYYTTDNAGAAQFWFGAISDGTVVSGGGFTNDPVTYETSDLNALSTPSSDRTIFTFGKDGTYATNLNVPTQFPTSIFDRGFANEAQAYSKSIDLVNDVNGGLTSNIAPSTVGALFQGTGQLLWRASATGVFESTDTGGNAAKAQSSTAKVAMQVIYEYTGTLTSGDPQFAGFQGQSFQVHGYPGSYFHLFSAPSFQMNGRFAYLASGSCTYKHTVCWTHPGTYIDDLTFVVKELLVRVTAGPVGQGYSVRINDEPFHGHEHLNATDAEHTDHDGIHGQFTPTKFYDAATRLTVHLKSPLELIIRTELVSFTITNADQFFNIGSQLMVRPILTAGRKPSQRHPHPVTGMAWFPSYPIHGFVGQTWAAAKYAGNKQYQGDVDDYVETRPYATDSIYSQYNQQFPIDMQFE